MGLVKDEVEEVSKRFAKDIDYIKKEVMARQIDGAYCKWSRPLKCVSVVGITYGQYIKFWEKLYKDYPEYLPKIIEACVDKLENGLIPREEMAQMIADSNDFISEKESAISKLGGIYIDE